MLDKNTVHKFRSKSTIKSILLNLEEVSLDELIIQTYIDYSRYDDRFKMILQNYEKMLLLSKIDVEKFKSGFVKFLKNNAFIIKKQNLYREFFEFTFIIYSNLKKNKTEVSIKNAYLSLLMEQTSYLENNKKTICGVNKKGLPIEIDEPMPMLDYAAIEYQLDVKNKRVKGYSTTLFEKYLKRYGYNINDGNEFAMHIGNQQLITNMLFHLTPFINDNTEDIIPVPYYLPTEGYKKLARKWKETSIYKEALNQRSYMLPTKGIKIDLNDSCSFRNISFKEIYMNNNIYLLYKIQMNDMKYISGYYDINEQFFYSVWGESSQGVLYHNNVENFILEIYTLLTTNIECDEMAINIINNSIDIKDPTKIYAWFDEPKKRKVSNYNYKDELISVKHEIKPFIRKLPLGSTASPNAVKLAESYGYKLKDNETFVNKFTKNIKMKEK